MTVADDVTLDDLILAKDDLSGADIKVRVSLALHLELLSKTARLVKHVGIALNITYWTGETLVLSFFLVSIAPLWPQIQLQHLP